MTKPEQETFPVPRKRLFVLTTGDFVVQWEENRVQDLTTGRYRTYSENLYGSAITDYELNQLKNTGIVADYDDELVYLASDVNMDPLSSSRTFYLNTTVPKSQSVAVREALAESNLDERFSVRTQDVFVILRDYGGMAFYTFDEAERARELLLEQGSDLFKDTVVAFVEINPTP